MSVGGFIKKGSRGLTGLVVSDPIIEVPEIEYNNKITIYIERDFTNTNYKIGDIIILDPVLQTIKYNNITSIASESPPFPIGFPSLFNTF